MKKDAQNFNQEQTKKNILNFNKDKMIQTTTSALCDVYENILQLFISDDDLRRWMTKPFLVGDKAVATNSYSLVAVPEWIGNYEQCNETIGVYPLTPNCFKEIPLSVFKEAISKATLIDAYDEETTETRCDECNGHGEVEYEYYAEGRYHYLDGDCPVCDGSGTITETKKILTGKKVFDTSKYITIYKAYFDILNVQKLITVAEMLNEATIILIYQKSETSSFFFKIGECEVILMPIMRLNNEAAFAGIA